MSNAKINLVRFMDSSRIESLASPVARGVPLGYYFLSSRIQSINELVLRLTRAAEIAYGMRNVAALDEISRVLTSIPLPEATATGRYYRAVIAKRQGHLEAARAELEQLVACSHSPLVRARSLLTLGTVHESQGRISEASRLYVETARSAVNVDALALFGAHSQLSAIKSGEGDHHAALTDLEQLWPLLRIASRAYPHLYYLYHNDLAYELAQADRIDEAGRHSALACSSPLAAAYPEWSETAEEIRPQLERPIQVFVVAPQAEQKSQAKPAAAVIVTSCDLHTQDVASPSLTRACLLPLVLVKSFIISHPARAPPPDKP